MRYAILVLVAISTSGQAPSEAERHMHRGLELQSAGKSHDAVEHLRRAVKLNPNLTRAKDALALAEAETGQCETALARLLQVAGREGGDRDFKRAVELGALRCAMTLNRQNDALGLIQALNRDFPNDPEVLYIKTHAFTDLSIRASQDLLSKAPESYHTHLLNAESLEVQGKWDEAVAAYRKVLEVNPNLRGMHYRLARLIMSRPRTESSAADAKRELEAELKVNPNFAAAEFVLGEIARQEQNTDEAIKRFTRAAVLDPSFVGAHISLAQAYQEVGRASEAIPPLETAVKLQPGNPEIHFRLATVYRLSGRSSDAAREAEIHQALAAREQAERQALKRKLAGAGGVK